MTHLIRAAMVMVLMSSLLGGCAEMHHGAEAVGRVRSSGETVDEVEAVPVARSDVKTVRPSGIPRAPVVDMSQREPAAPPTVEASAVPTPQQIFDFHPAGSAPGSFRQPFIIDPDDGPLSADVRKTAAELKEFNATMKSGSAVASSKRCGEMDVAHYKLGCVGVKPKATASVPRDPLALQ